MVSDTAKQPALKPATELAEKSAKRYPNDSAEYRTAREALLVEEIELRRQIERVAKQRRALPQLLHLLGLPLLLTACQNFPATEPALSPIPAKELAFAQASCGGCHAIGPNEISSRSNAPPFPVIVNQEGLTRDTLLVWLRGAHNYPSEMDFYLDDRKVDALVDYMLTLRDPKYRRPPD